MRRCGWFTLTAEKKHYFQHVWKICNKEQYFPITHISVQIKCFKYLQRLSWGERMKTIHTIQRLYGWFTHTAGKNHYFQHVWKIFAKEQYFPITHVSVQIKCYKYVQRLSWGVRMKTIHTIQRLYGWFTHTGGKTLYFQQL